MLRLTQVDKFDMLCVSLRTGVISGVLWDVNVEQIKNILGVVYYVRRMNCVVIGVKVKSVCSSVFIWNPSLPG